MAEIKEFPENKEEMQALVQRKYELTLCTVGILWARYSGTDTMWRLPIGNWYIYWLLENHSKYRDYFNEEIVDEALNVLKLNRENMIKYQKEAFFSDPEVEERNWPWFDHLELVDNLKKKFSIDEMIKYNSRGTYFPDYCVDSICSHYMKLELDSPELLDIFSRKKSLEEKMLKCLKE